MSRTTKSEHRTDGWNTWRRLERTSRPAGRVAGIVADEIAADGEEADDSNQLCHCRGSDGTFDIGPHTHLSMPDPPGMTRLEMIRDNLAR